MKPFKWRPIETAPKDGERIFVKRDQIEDVGRWSDALGGWSPSQMPDRRLTWEPTLWRPFSGPQKWRPIETAPKDGERIDVRRVVKGKLVRPEEMVHWSDELHAWTRGGDFPLEWEPTEWALVTLPDDEDEE